MSIQKKYHLLGFLLFAVLMTACQPVQMTSSQPANLTDVTMMLDWVPNTNHTGLYVAQEKGWYEEAGLNVTIIQAGQSPVEQVVGNGQAEFGVSYQEGATLAYAEGVPLVSVAAVIQHNTSGFASRATETITRPRDLEGKTYGSFSSPIERPMLDLLMKCDDGNVDEVEFVDIGFADFLSVTEGEIDFAWIFYAWQGIDAELKGVELDVFMLQDWVECIPPYYTPIIVTHQTMVAEQPEIVTAFVSATSKGYEYAISNPDEAADILIQVAPENDPELVKASQRWLAKEYQAEAPKWGYQQAKTWQRYADWLTENGILETKVDTADLFTNDFVSSQ